MTKQQLKNSKIDAITALQSKYRRTAQAIGTGCDDQQLNGILDRIREQIAQLENELQFLG
jgi:polyhydroxyalkanoate synthesis regulator phasin